MEQLSKPYILEEFETALEGDQIFFHNDNATRKKSGGVIELVEEATSAYHAEQAEIEKKERSRRLANSLRKGKVINPFSRTMGG